jgi:hypothetical protein
MARDTAPSAHEVVVQATVEGILEKLLGRVNFGNQRLLKRRIFLRKRIRLKRMGAPHCHPLVGKTRSANEGRMEHRSKYQADRR